MPAKRALPKDKPVEPAKRVAFAALHHRDYRRYFFVIMASQMGDNIEHVISYWLLFQKFHSPALGGFAVISHWTPALFFAVYFGALADRHDCRRVLQAAQLMHGLSSMGHSFSYRHDSSVARLRSVGHPWHGRSGGWTRKPAHYP